MMRNPAKRVLSLLLALLLLAAIPVAAHAANFDLEKTGSITVRLRDVYHPDVAIGGTIRLHRVADALVQDSALTYGLTAEFAGSGVSMADYRRFDRIYYMDQSNARYLSRMLPEDPDKIRPLLDHDVADPWYTGDFTATWNDIVEGCEKILEEFA